MVLLRSVLFDGDSSISISISLMVARLPDLLVEFGVKRVEGRRWEVGNEGMSSVSFVAVRRESRSRALSMCERPLESARIGFARYLRKKTRKAGALAQMSDSCSSSWAQINTSYPA